MLPDDRREILERYRSLAEEYWRMTDEAERFLDPADLTSRKVSIADARRRLPQLRTELASSVRAVERVAGELGVSFKFLARMPMAAGGTPFEANALRAVYDDAHNQLGILSRGKTLDVLCECIAAASEP